jgi:hypothetical protein
MCVECIGKERLSPDVQQWIIQTCGTTGQPYARVDCIPPPVRYWEFGYSTL